MGLIDRDRPVLAAIQAALLGMAALILGLILFAQFAGSSTRHRPMIRALIEVLHQQCENYRIRYGCYPPTEPYEGSANLHYYLGREWIQDCRPFGPMMAFPAEVLEGRPAVTTPEPPRRLVDGWGRPIRYRVPGVHNPKGADIWSEGPDPRSPDDDIGNWATE